MTNPKFLQRRGLSWYVRVRVPPALQAAAGSTHIRKALGTKNRAEAERKKWKVVAEIKAHLEELRRGPPPKPALYVEHGDPREWSEQLRKLRAGDEHDWMQADAIEWEAQDAAEKIEAKHGEAVAMRWFKTATTTTKPLDDWLEPWLAGTNYREQTKEAYRRAYRDLRTMLELGDADVIVPEDITDDVAVRFVVDYLPAQGYTPASMSNRIGALSSFWIFLQQRRVVPLQRNPWRGHRVARRAVDGPRSRKSPEDERPFTEPELVALLHGTARAKAWDVYPRVRDLMLLGLYTAARLNELCSLRVSDVTLDQDPEAAIVIIRQGKTEAAKRTIAVTHWAALEVIQRRITGKPAGGQLFDELRPGGPDGKLSWTASKSFTRYRRECGVPDGTDFHSFRRTMLTLMEHKGIDYVAVARMVGHEIPTMMHAVYSAGASREALLKVADATRYSPEVEKAVAGLA